ncbi:MAG: hypothetical protein NTAFB01_31880 [Nitrospira sp.]
MQEVDNAHIYDGVRWLRDDVPARFFFPFTPFGHRLRISSNRRAARPKTLSDG